MFSKIFTVSVILAFFALSAECSFYPYYPYNDNYLSGQAGRGSGGGAQGDVHSRGGPSININPVNNAESHSDSEPFAIQRASSSGPSQY